MERLVEVSGVTKWFGGEQVLRGVDLVLPRGSVTAVLGRNGGGKSTLVKIVAGLLGRDGGEVSVLGRDPEALRPEDRQRIAYVDDHTAVAPMTRVKDELAFVRSLRRPRWDDARAAELLERFDVPLDKRVGTLSKGQQARLRLVLALSAEPELLLLDEPALGLDLFARHDLLEVIIETVEKEGRAILIVSHLLDDVERVADRIAFLRHGEIKAEGSIDELRARYRRVRVSVAPERVAALESAAGELLGVRRVQSEANGPPLERVVVLEDYAPSLVDALVERFAAEVVESRKMTLREIYFELLAGREEEVVK